MVAAGCNRAAPGEGRGMETGDEKCCAGCGRRIEWRAKWAAGWAQVRYCSAACRRRKPGATDRRIEAVLVEMLEGRARGASMCPGEVARRLFPDGWRGRMEQVRKAARRLVAAGRVEITQGGRVVDASTAKGAIRIRLVD